MFRKLLSLLSDVAVYGISSFLNQLIGFLLLPLYTRFLAPEQQGTLRQVLIITAFFTPLANLGMINAIFRRFNLDKTPEQRREVLSTGLCSVLVTSFSLLTVGLLAAPWLSRLAVGDDSAANLVRLNLVTMAAVSIGMVPFAILRADRRVKTAASINVAKMLVTVCVTIWLVVGLELGVWGVIVGTLTGELIMLAVQLVLTSRSFQLIANWATWKRLASYGLPMVPHQLQALLMSLLPTFAIGPLLGVDQVGIFDIATKFTAPIMFIVNSVQNAWVPYKFQIHAKDQNPAHFFRTAVTYYVAGVLYLWVGVSLWGPEMVWLMADPSYYSAAALIPILGLVPVAQGVYFMMGTGMELSDDTRPFPLVTLAGLITAVVSIFTFVPWLGSVGAAIASINSFIALTLVIFYFSQRRFPISYDWPTLASLFVAAVVAASTGYWALQLPAIQRLPLAIAISLVFPLVEFAILSRSTSEWERMQIVWSKFTGLSKRFSATKPQAE